MPKPRLSVVVTRRLPEIVETRLSELFDVTLREDDQPMTRGGLGGGHEIGGCARANDYG